MHKTILIFIGPPGSGKGTQADMLAEIINLPSISPGELIRHEQEIGSKVGKQTKKFSDKGDLVPNSLIENLLHQRLDNKDTKAGFILDGYPRGQHQLDSLINKLGEITKDDDKIYTLEIWVSDNEVKERISGRRACDCGLVYHLKYNPPKDRGRCDVCGKKLYIRNDDKPEVLSNRLKLYHRESEPLLSYWREDGKLIKVNGEQKIKKVHQDIINKLKRRGILVK